MKNIIQEIHKELEHIKTKNGSLRTGDIRRISAQFYRRIKGRSTDDIFNHCEQLLETNESELKLMAFDWAFKERKNYTVETFNRFEKWLIEYVIDWWDCDDFCTHALGYLLNDYPSLIPNIEAWLDHENFAVRRAAPVALIPVIRNRNKLEKYPFEIADKLLHDEHYLVIKGYGWLLKVFAEYDEESVIDYLRTRVNVMPRLAFRYALEKIEPSKRKALMAL